LQARRSDSGGGGEDEPIVDIRVEGTGDGNGKGLEGNVGNSSPRKISKYDTATNWLKSDEDQRKKVEQKKLARTIRKVKGSKKAEAHERVGKEEVTAIALDWTGKKIIVGTSIGELAIFQTTNMAKLSSLERMEGEITSIKVLETRQIILTSSWDGDIKVHTMREEGPLTMDVVNHHSSFKRLLEVEEYKQKETGRRGGLSLGKKQFDSLSSVTCVSGMTSSISSSSFGMPAGVGGHRRGSIVEMMAERSPAHKDGLGKRASGRKASFAQGTKGGGGDGEGNERRRSSKKGSKGKKILQKSVSMFVEERKRKRKEEKERAKRMVDLEVGWEVKEMEISPFLGQLATVTTNPIILIWDIFTQHPRALSSLTSHTSDISCLTFLDPNPALLSGDMGGTFIIWGTFAEGTAGAMAGRKIHQFENQSVSMQSTSCALTSVGWDSDTGLISGDTEGVVKVWNLNGCLEDRGVQQMGRPRLGSQVFEPNAFDNLGKEEADTDEDSEGEVERDEKDELEELCK